jgi:hypothetical protein
VRRHRDVLDWLEDFDVADSIQQLRKRGGLLGRRQ